MVVIQFSSFFQTARYQQPPWALMLRDSQQPLPLLVVGALVEVLAVAAAAVAHFAMEKPAASIQILPTKIVSITV